MRLAGFVSFQTRWRSLPPTTNDRIFTGLSQLRWTCATAPPAIVIVTYPNDAWPAPIGSDPIDETEVGWHPPGRKWSRIETSCGRRTQQTSASGGPRPRLTRPEALSWIVHSGRQRSIH